MASAVLEALKARFGLSSRSIPTIHSLSLLAT